MDPFSEAADDIGKARQKIAAVEAEMERISQERQRIEEDLMGPDTEPVDFGPVEDEDDDEDPSIARHRRLGKQLKELADKKAAALLEHEARVEDLRHRVRSTPAHLARTEASRKLENRLGWAATVSIAALGSLAVTDRLTLAGSATTTRLALLATLVLGVIVVRLGLVALMNAVVEQAARVRAKPGGKLFIHRLSDWCVLALPYLPFVALAVQLVLTALLARRWIILIGALSKTPTIE